MTLKRDPHGFIQYWSSTYFQDRTPTVKGDEREYKIHSSTYHDDPDYARCPRMIQTTRDLKRALRHGPYTFPGAYELYFVTNDGSALRFAYVVDNLRTELGNIRDGSNDRIIGVETADWLEEPLMCDGSNKWIVPSHMSAGEFEAWLEGGDQ
jgi:hypothetical protein